MTEPLFAGRRILVIDDDPAVRSVLQQHFELRGADMALAESGRQGIETAWAAGPFDLVILDVMLPDQEGFEVCKSLKADDRTQRTPVMFLTACEETRERVKGLRAGAVDYIVKPFDLEEVALRADIALRMKSDLAEPNGAPAPPQDETAAPASPATVADNNGETLARDEFIEVLGRRFTALDPEAGLLSLVLIRPDQEDFLGEEQHAGLRQEFMTAVLDLLRDHAPKGSVLGLLDPLQAGVLIPRKNKYVAELMLDEMRNLLALRSFRNGGEEHHLTVSCGVSEYPNPQIHTVEQFEEKAEFAVRRAQRLGGDQTVLM